MICGQMCVALCLRQLHCLSFLDFFILFLTLSTRHLVAVKTINNTLDLVLFLTSVVEFNYLFSETFLLFFSHQLKWAKHFHKNVNFMNLKHTPERGNLLETPTLILYFLHIMTLLWKFIKTRNIFFNSFLMWEWLLNIMFCH